MFWSIQSPHVPTWQRKHKDMLPETEAVLMTCNQRQKIIHKDWI